MLKSIIIFNYIFLLFFSACIQESSNVKNNKMVDIKNVPPTMWNNLSQKRFFFGHQSVGYNIIEGVKMNLSDNPDININIVEIDSSTNFNHPVLAHSKNGQNHDPKSKIDGFVKIMKGGMGDQVDVAAFKFCYVDFKEGTDIDGIFKYYKTKMDELSSKYPNTKIIHITVPLRTTQKGIKRLAYRLLGREIGIEDNLARLRFNTLIRNNFNNQLVFDLAQIESTHSDGQREFDEVKNEKIYSLVQNYSSDGGHLSEEGKYLVGGEFLLFLVGL